MPLPVINISQMRDWEEATWASGQTEAEVIVTLAGKGNNGADARAAHGHLAERRVDVLDVKEPQSDLTKLDALLSLRPALIIDGLFGIGINRPLSPEWIKLIQRVNETLTQVLAVDVPSGLNGDTGEPQGAAIQATVTLTVGAPKVGMLCESALPYVGRLEVAT